MKIDSRLIVQIVIVVALFITLVCNGNNGDIIEGHEDGTTEEDHVHCILNPSCHRSSSHITTLTECERESIESGMCVEGEECTISTFHEDGIPIAGEECGTKCGEINDSRSLYGRANSGEQYTESKYFRKCFQYPLIDGGVEPRSAEGEIIFDTLNNFWGFRDMEKGTTAMSTEGSDYGDLIGYYHLYKNACELDRNTCPQDYLNNEGSINKIKNTICSPSPNQGGGGCADFINECKDSNNTIKDYEKINEWWCNNADIEYTCNNPIYSFTDCLQKELYSANAHAASPENLSASDKAEGCENMKASRCFKYFKNIADGGCKVPEEPVDEVDDDVRLASLVFIDNLYDCSKNDNTFWNDLEPGLKQAIEYIKSVFARRSSEDNTLNTDSLLNPIISTTPTPIPNCQEFSEDGEDCEECEDEYILSVDKKSCIQGSLGDLGWAWSSSFSLSFILPICIIVSIFLLWYFFIKKTTQAAVTGYRSAKGSNSGSGDTE
tara:strand:+ start:1469 stop:2947 length:1479 start_codon:yes stop_codon:yes gene_type:complete